MTVGRWGLGLVLALVAGASSACDYAHAQYAYSSNSNVSARFQKVPKGTHLVSDVAMAVERDGKAAMWFVFDEGASVTPRMSETVSQGKDAWRTGAGAHRALASLPFYGWSSNYNLLNSVPQAASQAPDVIFVPDLDETLRHLPDLQFSLGQGVFKLERCR